MENATSFVNRLLGIVASGLVTALTLAIFAGVLWIVAVTWRVDTRIVRLERAVAAHSKVFQAIGKAQQVKKALEERNGKAGASTEEQAEE